MEKLTHYLSMWQKNNILKENTLFLQALLTVISYKKKSEEPIPIMNLEFTVEY